MSQPHRSFLRRSGLAVVGALVAAALVPSAGASARSAPPGRLALPDGSRPEGIEARGTTAYVGSLADGDIYATDVRTGRGRVISQGDGTPAVGLELGRGGDLWAAGGADGDVKVVKLGSGRVRADFHLAAGETFINDVVVRRGTAWVTDSLQAGLFRIRHGHVSRLALGGQWVQTPGVNNANGIETTPNGRGLLVINSSNGILYRVNPQTGRAVRVRLGGTVLTNGDGLLREGRTLWVVQNRSNQVAKLRLAPTGRSGRLVVTRTSPAFDVPTTVARSGRFLYLPNARFSTPPTPTTSYDVTRIRAYR